MLEQQQNVKLVAMNGLCQGSWEPMGGMVEAATCGLQASKTTLVEPLPPILGTTTMASTPFALLLTILTVALISVMIFFLVIDIEIVLIDQFFWQTTFAHAREKSISM